MSKINNFTEGKILSPLLRFAFPILLALLLQTMYGAVDLMIVGKYAETADISAVATGTQIMQTITSFLVGLASGIAVSLGQKIGEGNEKEAGDVVGTGLFLFFLVTVVVTALMVIFTKPLVSLMNAPEEAFEATADYVRICSAGTVFIIGYNLISSIFRGIGDSKLPLISVFIACIFNIGGDLLLVAVFHMGAAGAALATVGAQAFSVLLSLLIIRRRKLPFRFSFSCIRLNIAHLASILRIGTPIAFQDLLVSISFLVILAIVNSLGLIASAGVGVAEKLVSFIMLIPSAFSQSMSAFVAQNIGARKPERANRALFVGIGCSLAVGFFMFYLAFFQGSLLCGIFSRDDEVIAAAASYLKAYGIDCLLTSFLFCFIGYFSGMGRSLFVMTQGLVGAFGVRIPVSFLMSRLPNVTLFKVGLATPASSLVQILLCGWFFFRLERKRKRGEL